MLAAAAADMATQESNYEPQRVNSTSLENGFKAVIKAMSGPRATLQWMVEQLRKYRWVIAGCVGIALGVCKLLILPPSYALVHGRLPCMLRESREKCD